MTARFSSYVVNQIITTGDDSVELRDTNWEDLRFPATAVNPPGLISDPDFDTSYVGWLFDASSTESLYLIAQLPHSIKLATNIHPHLHWCPTTTGAGNVLWRMEYTWVAAYGEVQPSSYTTVDIQPSTTETAYYYFMTEFAEISKPTEATGISDILSIKLSRIGGSDTYAADALLKEFDIHYEIDRLGSRSEMTK